MNVRVLRRAAIALGLLALLRVVALVGRLPGIGAEADPQGEDATGTASSKAFSLAVIALSALCVLGATTAFAFWSSTGSATGTASTGSVLSLTTTASTPSGATLVPGGSAPLVLTVTNPNPMPVVIGSVRLDATRAVTATGSAGVCTAPPVTVAATTSVTLAAGSTTTVTVPAAVTLGASASSGCQGATFTIPVTLSGSTA